MDTQVCVCTNLGEAGCSQRTVTCLQRVLSLYTLWDVAASLKQAPQSICRTGRKQDASYGAHIRQGCNYSGVLTWRQLSK